MKLRLSSILLLGVIAAGCHNEPSPTGIGLLPGTDLVGLETFDTQAAQSPVRSSTTFTPTPAATSPYLSLGKTAEYESSILLRWLSFPADIAEGGAIVSATVTLYRAPYGFGDVSAPLHFEAREVQQSWSSHTFTSDSLQNLRTGATPVGAFSGAAGDSVTFTIDSTLVRSWLKLMSSQRYTEIYGLLLKAAGGTNAVLAFESFERLNKAPSLVLKMVYGGKDTVFNAATLEDTFIAKGPQLPPTGLAVHGGLSYRGKVRFDVSAVPRGCIVNQATLTLTIDPTATRKQFRTADSLVVYELKDSAAFALGDVSMVTQKADTANRLTAKSFALTQIVQRWVNHPEMNHGLALLKLNEASDLDLIGLFGAEATPERRPRLTILYTKKP